MTTLNFDGDDATLTLSALEDFDPGFWLGFPADVGRRLGTYVLATCVNYLEDLSVDLRGLKSGLVTSGFFHGFLGSIHEVRPDLLDKARVVKWDTDFPFQAQTIHRVMSSFTPRSPDSEVPHVNSR